MPDTNNNDWHDVFVSYSHYNVGTVLPDVQWLKAKGHLVWFDGKIHAGTDWGDELAEAIDRSQFVFFFASERSIHSPHCLNEIAYAIDANKPVVPIYLDQVQLAGGLKLAVSRTQAISRWQLSLDEYRQQLRSALARNCGIAAAIAPAESARPKTNWQVPLLRNRYFEGRDEVLDRVSGSLKHSTPPIVALTGLAGVGKTQVALEYTYRHRTEYDLVAWIRAEEDSTIEADLVDLADRLGLENAGDPATAVVLNELRQYLGEFASWLIVLDNVERPEMLSRYLPSDVRGHVVVTSRLQNWGHYADALPVDIFPLDNAVGFLQQRLPDADTEATTMLVETLGRLPLALEEAAAYMEATGRSVSRYQLLFEKHHDALFRHARSPDDYPQTFGAALEVSLQQVESEDELAAHILKLLACVAPDDISIPLMFSAELEDVEDMPVEIAVDRCISSLRKYSIVKVEEDAVSLHRLVQLFVRDRMTKAELEEYVTRGTELIESVFPRVRKMGPQAGLCRRLMPHAIAVCALADEIRSAHKSMGLLLGRTGTFLSASGWNTDALNHVDRAYQVFRKLPGERSLLAYTCEMYAGSLLNGGLLDRAQAMFDEAIDIYASLEKPKPQRELGIHALLAWVHWCQGDVDRARTAATMSLDASMNAFGANDPQRIGALGILARIQLDSGRAADAQTTIDEAIQAIEKLGGFRLPLMCGVFMQMAHVLLYLGMPERAQSWAEEAIHVGRPALSEVHPLIATSRCVLGQIKLTQGEPRAALDQLKSAVAACTDTGYKLNQYMVVAASYLVWTLITLEKLEQAERIAKNKLNNVREQIAGDSDYAESMAKVVTGLLNARLNRGDEALALCTSGDEQMKARYGDRHSYRLETLLVLGDVQGELEDFDAARSSYALGIRIARHNGLAEHPTAAAHHAGLARIEEATGDDESAAVNRQRAADILTTCLGPLSRRVLELQA